VTKGAHRKAGHRDGAAQSMAFAVVDELTCYFDTPNEPANIHLEMRIPHQLDLRAFREAALAALAANPRAASRRARHSPLRRGYTWEQPDSFDVDPVSFTSFTDVGELAAQRTDFIAASPSIDASPPASLLVATGPDCAHVILNAHHATMDGISWLALLRDLGRRYRALAGGLGADGRLSGGRLPSDRLPSDRPSGGQSPDSRPPDGPVPARPPAPVPSAPATATARSAGRPARIAPDGGGARGLGVHMMLLPGVPAVAPLAVSPAPALRDGLAVGPAPTLNDALIAALAVAIGRWNADHGQPARTSRITVPMNARAAGSPHLGNLTRLVTIFAAPPAPDDGLGPLLAEVARQTRAARDQSGAQVGPGISRLAGLWCPAPVKRWLVRTALRTVGPLVCDTVMLTNLGNVPDPPDFGGGPITMAVSGPAQMPRGISLATITAGGQPQLAMRYNRALLSDTAAARFLAAFGQAIGELTVPADVGVTRPLGLDWSPPNTESIKSLQARRP
jgi:NRPS condensation-like uncharacterized protein